MTALRTRIARTRIARRAPEPAEAPAASVQPGVAPPVVSNQSLLQYLRTGGLWAKLAVGSPDDPAEADADRTARRMIEGPAPPCACGGVCDDCRRGNVVPLRRSSLAARNAAFGAGPGRPLEPGLRAYFEPRLRTPLDAVRVHAARPAAASARSIGARAFTAGDDIGFAAGQFAPHTGAGKLLLAHELAHVAQQQSESGVPTLRRAPDPQPKPDAGAPPAKDPDPAAQATPADPAAPGQLPKLVKPPDPKGELVVNTDTNVTFSDNAEYVRFQLQSFVALNGTTRLGVFDTGVYRFGNGMGPFLDPPVANQADATHTDYLARVITLVKSELASLRLRMTSFLADFERRGVDTLTATLDSSQKRVEEERDRYQVKSEGGETSVETGKETEDLTAKSRDLIAKQQVVVAAKASLDAAQEYGPNGESAPGGVPDEGVQEKEKTAREAFNAAQRDYALARHAAEQRHPIMAGYELDPLSPTTAETLAKLGSTSSTTQAETLAQQIDEKLDHIKTVREKVLHDWGKIWDLPSVIDATQKLPDIQNYPGLIAGVGGTVVAEKRGQVEADAEILSMFTGIAVTILALAASVPTGGLSVAGAGAVSAAGAGEQLLLAAMAARSLDKYNFESAAAGTDFDKAKSISQGDPSFFWVALDLVAAIAGPASAALKGAKTLFQRLMGLRRAYMAAKTAGKLTEAGEALGSLVAEGDAAGGAEKIGSRLASETEEVAAAATKHASEIDEIRQNMRLARKGAKPGSLEVPVEGEGHHYWENKDGVWCRYSNDPFHCFFGGSPEAQAIDDAVADIANPDEDILLHHGTNMDAPGGGYEGLQQGGIDVKRSLGHDQDLGQAFYVTETKGIGDNYALTRVGQRGGKPVVMTWKVKVSDLGDIVDIRPGGKDFKLWDQFLDQPPSWEKDGMIIPGARTNREVLSGPIGTRIRGKVFDEFIAQNGLKCDTAMGEVGGATTGGIGTGTQVGIRSQKVADRMNALMKQPPPAPAAPTPTTPPSSAP